jgi:hypothetical protein
MERWNQELTHYEGNNPPPTNKNAVAQKLWWGIRIRTLAW